MRKVNESIPILFMTARDDIVSKQKGFAAGIDNYMVKPIDLEELVWRACLRSVVKVHIGAALPINVTESGNLLGC